MANGTSAAQIEQDIYVGQDFYVPAYRICVGGLNPLEIEYDVLSVSYTDSDADMDSFDLTINNWDPDGDGPGLGWFKYSDSHMFDPWQDVQLDMGYYNQGNDELETMLVGEIVRATPNFPESGPSTMSVHCVNLLQRFRTSQVSKNYFNKQDSWIARDLVQLVAAELRKTVASLDLVVDAQEISQNLANEQPVPYLDVHQQYPVNFLFARSRAIGYDIWVEDTTPNNAKRRTVTLHYAPGKYLLQPTYILEWGKSLTSFQPSFGIANLPDEVTVRSWNPAAKAKFEATATRSDLAQQCVFDPTANLGVQQGPLAKKTELITDVVVQSNAEAKLVAVSRMIKMSQDALTAKGRAVGLPDLRMGSKVSIQGLGRFSGMYQLTGTTHTIGDGGYTTDFSATLVCSQ